MSGRDEFSVSMATMADADAIVALVNAESERSGAVLTIDTAKIAEWIKHGICLVARTPDGKVVGHLAAHRWSGCGWVELRSSVVDPEFRGRGISSALTSMIISEIKARYGSPTIVAFTNKAGTGHGILEAVGMDEAEYDSLPEELFSIGPAYRGKKEYGYRVYVRQ